MSSTWLITGASRGIGFELVKQLAPRSDVFIFAGARDPSTSTELQSLAKAHSNILIIKFAVTSEKDLENALHEIEARAGGLDVLVSNAGVMGNTGFFKDGKPSEVVNNFKTIFETNVYSVLRVDLAFLPLLRKRATRKIINISSVLGSISQVWLFPTGSYNTSKTAVNMISKQLSMELQPEDFTVIALHPGWVQTEMGSSVGNAPLTPEESIRGQLKVIDSVTKVNSGEYRSYDGSILPY